MLKFDEKIYAMWLSNIYRIRVIHIKKLLDYFKSFENIYNSTKFELIKLEIPDKIINQIVENKDLTYILEKTYLLEKWNINYVVYGMKNYPSNLTLIQQPPKRLYYIGLLPSEDKKKLAVVGSRNYSPYGKIVTESFVRELSKFNVEIISGMAKGIDSIAHYASLTEKNNTYAVLGCGVNVVYPKDNLILYNNIIKCGGIISEYEPTKTPETYMFPYRNRLIVGLADALLVTEANLKSGALITVDYALEQSKEVYVIPSRITDEKGMGSNQLLQQGARIVLTPKDILEEMSDTFKIKTYLNEKEEFIYNFITKTPIHLEELIQKTKLPFNDIVENLSNLLVKGIVIVDNSNYYVRNKEIL